MSEQAAQRVRQAGLAVRPEAYLLWGGVPIEELGIRDALLSVSFAFSVGRTKPSKHHHAGVPKVGGAQVEFELSDPATARRLASLLHENVRPTITVGFGYEGQAGYWVGGFVQGTAPDRHKAKRVGGFKMERVTWNYDGGSLPKVTLAGRTDKAIGLVEKLKPRVYTDTTIRRIFEGVADEHGLFLDIDESLRFDARVQNVVKTSQEDDWQLLSRMGIRAGAAGMYLREAPTELGEVGAAQLQPWTTSSQGTLNRARTATQVRNILRVSRLPGFLDVRDLAQERPVVIAYDVGLSQAVRETIDYRASSITIAEDGYKTDAVPSSAQAPKDGDGLKEIVFGGLDLLSGATTAMAFIGIPVGRRWTPRNPQKADRRQVRDGEKGPGVYHVSTSPLPDEVDDGALTSEYLAAVALARKFSFDVQVNLPVGVPFLQPPSKARILGTHAHDGLYGLEEATTRWDGRTGLTSSLKLKPIDVAEEHDHNGPSTTAKNNTITFFGRDLLSDDATKGTFVEIQPGVKWSPTRKSLPTATRRRPTPVPATPEEAAALEGEE